MVHALGGVLYFNPEKFADAHTLKPILIKIILKYARSNSSLG
jgi:hypothetical protein